MKQYIKYICLFLILGMSTEMWGAATTGTINFGSNGTKINAASVSGSDSQGNTWNVTTVGTTSYTQQPTYAQVGSSDNPATSITFTMTLPASKTITAFSAKFGGFSSTAGTVTLKVGSTTVGSGSLSGASDVVISNSSTETGTVLTVTVTSISKGVKCYYVSYTCGNSKAYYVVYDPQGGTCATEDDTEASANAGVELPDVTPSSSDASMGWGFYGWAEEAVDDPTTTAPTIVGKAGDTYYPEDDIILYAVFAKGEYTKVTSTSEITVGSGEKYLIMGYDDVTSDDGYGMYVMTHQSFIDGYNNEYMYGYRLGDAPLDTYSAAAVNANWRYIITKSTTYYYFQNIASSKYVDTESAANRIYTSSLTITHKYIITFSSNGYCTIKNNATTYDYPYLNVFDGDGAFSNGSSGWEKMMIYKETITPKYCSQPATLKLVASPVAGGTVEFDDNSSDVMDFDTDDGYIGNIIATPASGYDFLYWESSDEDVAVVSDDDDATTKVIATASATLTAYFYQNHSITYNLTGVTGGVSNPTTVTKDEKDGFYAEFSLAAHYKNPMTYSVSMGGTPLAEGVDKDYEWADGILEIHKAITADISITVSAVAMEYTKYAFSCAELTLTVKPATAGTPIFITSTAGKTVRSQDTIQITGNGLTPSTTLTFPGLPSKFAIKKANGTALATDGSGEIDENAFIFYTPDAEEDTSDGLDKLIGITASVGGAKPKIDTLRHDIIGRHLPADFVIAGKKDGKWWAMPSDMASTTNPKPSEIAVNDYDNPSVAYTDASNKYGLAAPTASNISGGNGQYIRLTMSIEDGNDPAGPAPLFGSATGTRTLGKSSNAKATSDLSAGWWWQLKQTNTSISNPQDAKYTIYCANNTSSLSLRDNAGNPDWGFFASGVEELRLISASSVVFTEAEIVAWGQHNAIVEVDKANAGGTGVAAEKVKAKLNGSESSLITLAETGTSKGSATKYDYTVAFGDEIDFAANAGQMLTLEWYNSSDALIAVSNIMVPTIVASNITINKTNYSLKSAWNTEVHVLPGVTVTVDASAYDNSDVTIKELNIYPGATVNVYAGTLKATTLVLRNGWDRLSATKKYDVARLYITPTNGNLQATKAYADWYIDFDQYYPIAVPWEVDLGENDGSKLNYLNTNSSAIIGEGSLTSVRLRYYDGESRATNGQTGVGSSANWKLYGGDDNDAVPSKLVPGKGYAMTAKRPTGKAFSIIRMPLNIPSADWTTGGEKGVVSSTHKDQVTVKAWGVSDESKPRYIVGWNFIANPYMAIYQGAITHSEGSTYDIEHVNIPDIDFKEFGQYAVGALGQKLLPASGFLIQAEKDGTLTFGASNRKASAPSYRNETAQVSTKQKAYITLDGANAEDMMGLLICERYTADYDINGDLQKLLSDGNTLRAWMNYINMSLAYVAVNEELAKEWIPVSVRIPEAGEYTFRMHEASIADELEGVYLIDYQTGITTNLMYDSYTFTAEAGTNTERFAINAIVGERKVPTSMDVTGGDVNGNEPVKFIWHDKVYIFHNNVIYDSTGKRVNVINK